MSRTRLLAIDAPNRLVIDGFLDVLVVDRRQKPVAGVLCEVILPDDTVRLQVSDAQGMARFPRVAFAHRSCTIRVHPRPATKGENATVHAAEELRSDDDAEDVDEDVKQIEQHADDPDDAGRACAPPIDDGFEPDELDEDLQT